MYFSLSIFSITTEDKYSSKVGIEEEETEIDKKIKDRRKENKMDNQIIRIQKTAVKVKAEENSQDAKEPEIPEPGKLCLRTEFGHMEQCILCFYLVLIAINLELLMLFNY